MCDYLNEYYGSIAELQNIMYWGAYKTEDFELEQEWFVVDYDYHIGYITQWNRVYETSIQNVSVSNVNYRIDNNTIYFDETVNNIQLFDLQGRLLYHNKNTGTLNVGNNLKGVYLLKYDGKAVKVRF